MATSMWNGSCDMTYFSNNLPPVYDLAMEMTGPVQQWSSADMDFLMEVNEQPFTNETSENAIQTESSNIGSNVYQNNLNGNNEQCFPNTVALNGFGPNTGAEDALFIPRTDLVNAGGGLCVKPTFENNVIPYDLPSVTAVDIGGTSYYVPYTGNMYETDYQQAYVEMSCDTQYPYLQQQDAYLGSNSLYHNTYFTDPLMYSDPNFVYQYQNNQIPWQNEQCVFLNQFPNETVFENVPTLDQTSENKQQPIIGPIVETGTNILPETDESSDTKEEPVVISCIESGENDDGIKDISASDENCKNDSVSSVIVVTAEKANENTVAETQNTLLENPTNKTIPCNIDKSQSSNVKKIPDVVNKVQNIGLPVPFNPLVPPPPLPQTVNNQTPNKVLLYDQKNRTKEKTMAAAITPSGYKFYIPLDDRRYALKKSRHDLYDIPDRCSFHVFETEGQFESSVMLNTSPRPVQIKGSLSDNESESGESNISRQTSAKQSESLESMLTQADNESTAEEEEEGKQNIEPDDAQTDKSDQGNDQSNNDDVEMKTEDCGSMKDECAPEGMIDSNDVQECIESSDKCNDKGQTRVDNEPILNMDSAADNISHEVVVSNEYDYPPRYLNMEEAGNYESFMDNPDVCYQSMMDPGSVAFVPQYPHQWHQMPFQISIMGQDQTFSPEPLDQSQYMFAQEVPVCYDNVDMSQSWYQQPVAAFQQNPRNCSLEQAAVTGFSLKSDEILDPMMQPAFSAVPADSYTEPTGGSESDLTVPQDLIDPADGLAYPALHISDEGLVTVILRHGLYVEMTTDKAIRLVNHELKLVAAFNSTGSKACLIHPAARIYQSETTVDTDISQNRKAKMSTSNIVFGNENRTYKFDYKMINEASDFNNFLSMTEDLSVAFLETDTGFFNSDTSLRCSEVIGRAYFEKQGEKGCKVIINGTKIVQNDNGDVNIYSGSIRFLRMCPGTKIIRLRTQFVEIDIEWNGNLSVQRGTHTLNSSHREFTLSNGKIKASIDQKDKLHAFSLPCYKRLVLGQSALPRRSGPGPRRRRPRPNMRFEPENDHLAYIRH